jgi:hypothetical protein
MIIMPLATLSPVLIAIVAILPTAGDGTSIVALSLSSVTSGVSFSTWSPTFTSSSSTRTSPVVPRSGRRISRDGAAGGLAPPSAGGLTESP